MELALYVLSRAVESFALCLGQWGYVRKELLPGRLDVCMFSLATACILHCYSDAHGEHRDVFRSKYLNVLDFVLGSTGAVLGSCACCMQMHAGVVLVGGSRCYRMNVCG